MIVRIKGVGQIFDFESGEMRDSLQLEMQDGQQLSVPTDQATVQKLIGMRMNGGMQADPSPPRQAADPPVHPQHQIDESSGGSVFGGDFSGGDDDLDAMFGQDTGPSLSMSHDPPGLGDPGPTEHQRSANAKVDDRSGIPTRTLPVNLVDEKGNPITATPPDTTMDDDEEDPGEQI